MTHLRVLLLPGSLILSFLAVNLFAQGGYHPFPSDNATWIYRYYDDFHQPTWIQHEYSLTGDTVIGTQTYSKVYNGSLYSGCLREQQRKVYFVPDTSSTEFLLYDFNLMTGDTAWGIYGSPLPWVSDTVVVVWDDSVLCTDGLHHRICFSDGAKWIEGIGAENYLLDPLVFYGLSGNDYLECFRSDSSTVFPSGASGCFTSVEELSPKRPDIIISPHPVSGQSELHISSGFGIRSLRILDMTGKECRKIICDGAVAVTISADGLSTGLHLVEITTSSGERLFSRMLVDSGR